MNIFTLSGLWPLPIPPNYMRVAEQHKVRALTGPIDPPAGDRRSIEKMIEQSSVLKDFLEGNDRWQLELDLKWRLGDWTDANPDPNGRKKALYNLDLVLRLIDNLDEDSLSGSEQRNGKIDGFSNLGVTIQPNSEADRLDAFARHGYEVLATF